MLQTDKQYTSIRVMSISLIHSCWRYSAPLPSLSSKHGQDNFFTSSSSWCLTLPQFPFLPSISYHKNFYFSSVPLLVLFALAPGWEPAPAFWAAGMCCLPSPPVSELLQDPHRARVLDIPAFSSRKSSHQFLSNITNLANISCKYGRLKGRYLLMESVTSSKITWKIVTIIGKQTKEKKGLEAFCFRIIIFLILSYSY